MGRRPADGFRTAEDSSGGGAFRDDVAPKSTGFVSVFTRERSCTVGDNFTVPLAAWVDFPRAMEGGGAALSIEGWFTPG
jgi:hypothetical protein